MSKHHRISCFGCHMALVFLSAVSLIFVPVEPARAEVALSDQGPSPVAYWSFDECLTTSVRDDSGWEATGARLGGVGCATGRVRGAGTFDGVDDAVEISNRPSFQMTNAVTLAAWVKATDLTGTSTIVGKWYAPDSYLLGILDGNFSFNVTLTNGMWVEVLAPATSSWTHVAGTFDGNSAKLYVNGVLKPSKSAVGSLQQSTRPIVIGNHPTWNALSGQLDEVRLYRTALTATHMKKLAKGETYTVVPFYVHPSDQPYHSEYVTAIEAFLKELQVWYRQQSGVSFRRAPLRVKKGADYLTMRCGTAPSDACINDRQQLPNWHNAVTTAVGGKPARTVTLVLAQGGGGWVGANLTGDFVGYAIVGDWVLEPISGVAEPQAIHCGFADWQCSGGVPKGTVAHEIGHAFGLHHPDNYDGQSIMKWHGDYPNTTFMTHERQLLQLNPMLSAGVREIGNPWVNFENSDVVYWGDMWTIGGTSFSGKPVVQFVDGSRAVNVTAQLINSNTLSVIVPSNLGGGFVRVRQGDRFSNPVAVNFYP